MRVQRWECPLCGTGSVLPVRFGMPDVADVDNQDVILGGCLVPMIQVSNPVACVNSCGWSGVVLGDEVIGSVLFDCADELLVRVGDTGDVPFDEVEQVVLEVALGLSWRDPRSQVPDTPDHHDLWMRCTDQADTIAAARGLTW